ncbi:unnamed protein product [Pieris macdunnoughi]|uniref:Reverse transcriptase domain-containing protein n=1 Tax=Pieris macdunnoughi TaxID=345717 RepID=A0A821YC56_9NEOP|nr:unnamed protein product [Pieris macdunnoughi]
MESRLSNIGEDGLISNDIQVHAGVQQGCLLTPLIFLGIRIRPYIYIHSEEFPIIPRNLATYSCRWQRTIDTHCGRLCPGAIRYSVKWKQIAAFLRK